MSIHRPLVLTIIGLAFAVLTFLPTASAQTAQWRPRAQTVQPRPSQAHRMSYDSHRGRTVLFRSAGTGFGSETWEWNGVSWTLASTTGPGERTQAGMCYDSARRRTVLFGGSNGNAETWEWDGANWSLRSTTGPSRYFHAMAYDALRGRTVIQGGFNGGRLSDTWEWDGNQWTLAATAGPGPRQQHTMTFDVARGRVVLFGGYGTSSTPTGDLWEWDGKAWSLVDDSGPAVADTSLVCDSARGRLVVFGGWPSLEETWEWDGTTWLPRAEDAPPTRQLHAMAFDTMRGEAVLFGGLSDHYGTLDDTWAWNGSEWARRDPGPSWRQPAMTFDPVRNRTVLVSPGLQTDTWEWDGSVWNLRSTSGPESRYRPAMAFDASRNQAVFFGGYLYMPFVFLSFDDTWTWDGSLWTRLDTPGPSPRAGSAMTYDPAHQRVVLFGGWDAEFLAYVSFGDTWAWDGSSWTMVAAAGPSSREGASMVYDPVRQRVVLFGGQTEMGYTVYYNDTWEWDGQTWTQVASGGPPPRSYAAMRYDLTRERVIVTGGSPGRTDSWEWDGSTWTQTPDTPAPTGISASAYDSNRRQLVVFSDSARTWEFGIDCPADFNADGTLGSQDFFDFLSAFFNESPGADFNADGAINSQDFFDFLAAFFAGCP